MTGMLDELRVWFKANANRLKGEPICGTLRRSELEDETLTPPLYKGGFDLKSEKILAAFTVWGSGDVQVIIMDNETATELLIDDRRIDAPLDLHAILNHYCDQILANGPFTKY